MARARRGRAALLGRGPLPLPTAAPDHCSRPFWQARNFVVGYGMLCIVAGAKLTPHLLKTLDARGFTTLTNATNGLAFLLRGASPSSLVWVAAVLPLLPGVNGSSSNAIKAIVGSRANAEGFGSGEFSAYTNNLRALAAAAAPVLYGNVYAACRRKGWRPGLAFWVAAALGAAVPQLLLSTLSDSDLSAKPAAKEGERPAGGEAEGEEKKER